MIINVLFFFLVEKIIIISFENQKRNLSTVTELKVLNSVMVLWHDCSIYQWSLLTFVKELWLEEHKSAHSLRIFQGSNGNASGLQETKHLLGT